MEVTYSYRLGPRSFTFCGFKGCRVLGFQLFWLEGQGPSNSLKDLGQKQHDFEKDSGFTWLIEGVELVGVGDLLQERLRLPQHGRDVLLRHGTDRDRLDASIPHRLLENGPGFLRFGQVHFVEDYDLHGWKGYERFGFEHKRENSDPLFCAPASIDASSTLLSCIASWKAGMLLALQDEELHGAQS
jgi:hypothetical protein